jgi:hypothetical protein
LSFLAPDSLWVQVGRYRRRIPSQHLGGALDLLSFCPGLGLDSLEDLPSSQGGPEAAHGRARRGEMGIVDESCILWSSDEHDHHSVHSGTQWVLPEAKISILTDKYIFDIIDEL